VCAAGSCGSQNRTFTIPPSTEELNEHAQNETETQSESDSSRRLQEARGHERGNSREHSSQGEHGQQGSQPWASGSYSSASNSQAGRDRDQQQGLAHAFASGHGQGLALALGHVECSVLNNALQTRGCRDTCELPSCAGAPSLGSSDSSDGAVTVSSWGCTDVGTVNGTTCIGTCPVGNSTGTITAACLNGVYTTANTTCAIDSFGED
jgi:hypothetical protein